jgi:hypothetical protein
MAMKLKDGQFVLSEHPAELDITLGDFDATAHLRERIGAALGLTNQFGDHRPATEDELMDWFHRTLDTAVKALPKVKMVGVRRPE